MARKESGVGSRRNNRAKHARGDYHGKPGKPGICLLLVIGMAAVPTSIVVVAVHFL